MSTTLRISFPWGRYHATPWGSNANEGVAEWPPSPWRILRALYATWKWRAPDLDETAVRGALSKLADPPSFMLPAWGDGHTRHFMPDVAHGKDKAFDTFTVFEPSGQVQATWPAAMDAPEHEALVELCSRLPYLGRAESVCDARVAAAPDADGIQCVPADDRVPDADDGWVRVLVPRVPLDFETLLVRTVNVRKQGLIDPPGARWVAYQRPRPPQRGRPRHVPQWVAPTAFRWALATPARPSKRAAVTMADCLRRACMARFGRLFGGAVSQVLAGKDEAGTPLLGHQHAHYLAVDEDRDGLLDHVMVWAPGGFGERDTQALGSLDRLVGFGFLSDFRPARLGLEAFGDAAVIGPGFVGPSLRWRSHTPFAPPRHAKRRTPWDVHVDTQIREELGRRGLPEPEEIVFLRGDWLSYRRNRPTREPLEAGRSAAGLELRFAEPVRGPIALGALSHFGLGLFEPMFHE